MWRRCSQTWCPAGDEAYERRRQVSWFLTYANECTGHRPAEGRGYARGAAEGEVGEGHGGGREPEGTEPRSSGQDTLTGRHRKAEESSLGNCTGATPGQKVPPSSSSFSLFKIPREQVPSPRETTGGKRGAPRTEPWGGKFRLKMPDPINT